jgi:predicted transcriptional regulator
LNAPTVPYETIKEQLLADPQVRAAYEMLEPAHQVARLRIMRGLTQQQLAERVGTKQPSIARLESGKYPPNLAFLQRVVEALDGQLTVTIKAK